MTYSNMKSFKYYFLIHLNKCYIYYYIITAGHKATMADYSKSFIYKLFCKDEKVKDIYIGSCANPEHDDMFIPTRLPWLCHLHKSKIEGGRNYNMGLYKFIREHGGADNWDYEVTEFKCSSQLELLTEKQRIMDILKPSLNTRPALYNISKSRIKCPCGGYSSTNGNTRRKHEQSIMHKDWLNGQPIESKLKGSIIECKQNGKVVIKFRHQINDKRTCKNWTVGKRSYSDAMALAKQYQLEYNHNFYLNKKKEEKRKEKELFEEEIYKAMDFAFSRCKPIDAPIELENKEPIIIDLKGSIREDKSNGRTRIRFRHQINGKRHSKQWSVGKKRTLEEAMNLAKKYQIEYNKNL